MGDEGRYGLDEGLEEEGKGREEGKGMTKCKKK